MTRRLNDVSLTKLERLNAVPQKDVVSPFKSLRGCVLLGALIEGDF